MNFEEAMEKLEEITRDLEEGNLSLEESLEKFEEGMRLVNFCEKKLEEMEKRIKLIVKDEGKLKIESWQQSENKNKKDDPNKKYGPLFK